MLLMKKAHNSNISKKPFKTHLLTNWLSSIRKLLLLSQAQKGSVSMCRGICAALPDYLMPLSLKSSKKKSWRGTHTCNPQHHSIRWPKTSPTLTAMGVLPGSDSTTAIPQRTLPDSYRNFLHPRCLCVSPATALHSYAFLHYLPNFFFYLPQIFINRGTTELQRVTCTAHRA